MCIYSIYLTSHNPQNKICISLTNKKTYRTLQQAPLFQFYISLKIVRIFIKNLYDSNLITSRLFQRMQGAVPQSKDTLRIGFIFFPPACLSYLYLVTYSLNLVCMRFQIQCTFINMMNVIAIRDSAPRLYIYSAG